MPSLIYDAARTIARRVLPAPMFRRLKMMQRRAHFARASGFSEEEPVIRKYLDALPLANRFCVDIAAQDGIGGSQTLALFKQGWSGIAVEGDPAMFAILSRFYAAFPDVSLVRTKVTPSNVEALLHSGECPRDFAFLSLDIDSYDYFVLAAILRSFRPALMCVEINEIVPPPLRFTVRYDPNLGWEGNHFQGQSIAQCHQLCAGHGYDIVELHYNNLLLVPRELNFKPGLSPEEAYLNGYLHRADRKAKFPWNADVEAVLTMPRDEAIRFLDAHFAAYRGRYDLE